MKNIFLVHRYKYCKINTKIVDASKNTSKHDNMLYEVDPKTKPKSKLDYIVNNLNNLLKSFSDLRICTHVDFFFFCR